MDGRGPSSVVSSPWRRPDRTATDGRQTRDQVPCRFGARAVLLLAGALALTGCEARRSTDLAVRAAPSLLAGYTLSAGPIELEPEVQNASGIAYSPHTQTLFLIQNWPCRILELGLDGATRRVIALEGFGDTEDIAFVRSNEFAVVQEGRQTVCLVRIEENTTVLLAQDATQFPVDDAQVENNGLEGIAYDPAGDRFFVVKEKGPRRIYALPRYDTDTSTPDVRRPWDIEQHSLGLQDLAAVCFDARGGHLLLLSHESQAIVACTVDGRELGRLSLTAGHAGLEEDIRQAEGLTLDEHGTLYVCAEPNLLYVFRLPHCPRTRSPAGLAGGVSTSQAPMAGGTR